MKKGILREALFSLIITVCSAVPSMSESLDSMKLMGNLTIDKAMFDLTMALGEYSFEWYFL